MEHLQSLVYGALPEEAGAMRRELMRLKYEAALHQLDREFAAEREACLIRCGGSAYEPKASGFWVSVVLVGGLFLFFVNLAIRAWAEREAAMGWLFVLLGAVLLILLSFMAAGHYKKMKRLAAAKAVWERCRGVLEGMGPRA